MAKKKDAVKEDAVKEDEVIEKPAKAKEPTKAELAQKEADGIEFTDDVFYPVKNADGTYQVLDIDNVPVVPRAVAILKGFRRYYTGEECANGHFSPRKTKTSTCVACAREKLKERHARKLKEDPEYAQKARDKAKARRLRKANEKRSMKEAAEKQATSPE